MTAAQKLEPAFHVAPVSADKMHHHWDTYSVMLMEALRHSHRREDNILAVMDALADNNAHLVEVTAEDGIAAVALVEMVRHKCGGTWLNVWALAGSDMDNWIEPLDDYLTTQARRKECAGLTCGGRSGWERTLKRLGWNQKAVIMGKQI